MNSRVVLMAGFGGVLLLMAFAGIDSLQTLRHAQTSNDDAREDFLRRTRVLERVRADLYVSGTYVRDYLLEPESGKAEGHRRRLLETRKDMDAYVGQYRALVTAQEAQTFQLLNDELGEYWKVLEPIFGWTAEKRRQAGFPFLRDDVFPRRTAMLGIADQIRSIDESQLNAAKARMDQASVDFRRRLTVIVGFTIALGLVLATFSIRKILALERRTAADIQEIACARAELQQLSARLVAAQEDERRSISRELHDEVGQALTGVLVDMANLSVLLRTRDLDRVAAKVAEIRRQVENSLSVVRNMALLLRPSMLDDLGLVPAVEWQARETGKRSGIWIQVDAEKVSEELPEEHKTCVYRVVQEALHNIVQHAGARRVDIAIRQAPGRLEVSIQDDGKGFDAARERGMGLLGLEERVGHLGGTFTLDSQPGRGTVLRVNLPLVETPA